MNSEQIIAQSKAAYGQWAKQWREHARLHSVYKMKSLHDFENIGIGKAVLCVANGYSTEEHIEVIREAQGKVDILCCDKTLGHLLDNGITPTYCMVCDANVSYEKYLKPWENKLSQTILFNNVCGNPTWTEKGNWKDKYFFINKDAINSQIEFTEISGCQNYIPAGTNVSNAMVILLTQSDNDGARNFFGYDKILLIGYDYSWKFDGKYYAFDKTGDGKASYMKHSHLVTQSGKFVYTSGNLTFSAQWLDTYIKAFRLPVVQCSPDSILNVGKAMSLKEQINYQYKPQDSKKIRTAVNKLRTLIKEKREIEKLISETAKDHKMSFMCSV